MSTIDTFGDAKLISGASLGNAHVNLIGRLAGSTIATAKRFSQAMLRRRTRHELRDLSDELLRDIGITRAEAMREVNRSFWE